MLALRAMDVRQAFRSELGLLGAVVVGAAIRLDQIREQIVLDDEWHALHAILRFGYGRILTHFGWTDVCIPLAVFDKVVADTVGLSEMWMRLPVLLAGIASLLVLPLMLRAWLDRAAKPMPPLVAATSASQPCALDVGSAWISKGSASERNRVRLARKLSGPTPRPGRSRAMSKAMR